MADEVSPRLWMRVEILKEIYGKLELSWRYFQTFRYAVLWATAVGEAYLMTQFRVVWKEVRVAEQTDTLDLHVLVFIPTIALLLLLVTFTLGHRLRKLYAQGSDGGAAIEEAAGARFGIFSRMHRVKTPIAQWTYRWAVRLLFTVVAGWWILLLFQVHVNYGELLWHL